MGRGFDSIPDKSSRDNVRETDLFEVYQLNKKAKDTWVTLRFLPGDLLPIKKHWIKIMGGKDKDKEIRIPRMCVSYNPDDNAPLRGMKCPYCALEHGNDDSGAPAQYDFKWWTQAIVRDEQSTQPRKLPKHTKNEQKTGKKEKTSDSWTPVYCIPLTNSQAGMIRQMGERNFAQVKDKKSGQKVKTQFPITDAKYGLDVDIKYVPSNPPTNRYVMEKGDRSPLTEEEREYLTWDFSDWEGIYDTLGRLNEADAMTDFKKMDVIGSNQESDDDEDDDDDMSLGRKKKGKDKAAKSKKGRRDLDDEDDDEDDEDEDDRPKKKATKSKRLLDDDEDDDDEDEDDRPKKKKKKSSDKSSAKSSKKKRSVLADDDEDDDDEDEKPKKKKKSSDKSSKSKSSSKSDKSSVKKKKKSSDDDEPVKKKKKKK